MTYAIVTEPHECVLPDPADFPEGTEISCQAVRLRNGRLAPCGNRFSRETKGLFNRRAVWVPYDWGW